MNKDKGQTEKQIQENLRTFLVFWLETSDVDLACDLSTGCLDTRVRTLIAGTGFKRQNLGNNPQTVVDKFPGSL